MDRLYRIYWRPLHAQARRFGVAESDLEDVIQDFLLRIFSDGSLSRADPQVGRFRSYMVGALRHFLWQRQERAQAQKRGGGEMPLPLLAAEAVADPAPGPSDERSFDVKWARALFDFALARFEAEVNASPPQEGAEFLKPWAFGEGTVSYEESARKLGITVAAVKSRIFRLRHRFRQIVREEVLLTVASDADCEGELRYLCSVLGSAEGSLASGSLAAEPPPA